MVAVAEHVACGVAGWSYPDWDGIVYAGRIRDKLAYVASFVDMIEINSTFYRPPEARTAESWVRRTEAFPDFFFTAKLHQEITHGGRVTHGLADAFREGLAPMRDAGRLRHLLAQFRYDFADTPTARDHLALIRETFGGMCGLVMELRHNSWQSPGALEFLRGLGVTVANLDYPTARNSFNLAACTVGADAYFRLHGRNTAAWFSREAGRDEVYNYLYSRGELEGIRDRILRVAAESRTLTAVANNHYRGKELANALQLKALLTGRQVSVPPGLVAEYPELGAIARPP